TLRGLRFFFDYLDNKDEEIANDAFQELGRFEPADLRQFGPILPADRIVRWLEDPATPPSRYGLYAMLLGHCGTVKHAAVLRKLLDDPKVWAKSNIGDLVTAYTMLKPKDGWAYLAGILKTPAHDFNQRYGALRAVRFFWESQPPVIARKDLLEGV